MSHRLLELKCVLCDRVETTEFDDASIPSFTDWPKEIVWHSVCDACIPGGTETGFEAYLKEQLRDPGVQEAAGQKDNKGHNGAAHTSCCDDWGCYGCEDCDCQDCIEGENK